MLGGNGPGSCRVSAVIRMTDHRSRTNTLAIFNSTNYAKPTSAVQEAWLDPRVFRQSDKTPVLLMLSVQTLVRSTYTYPFPSSTLLASSLLSRPLYPFMAFPV